MSEASSHIVRSVRPVARAPEEAARRDARTVDVADASATVEDVVALLPDPDGLPPGTLVLVPGSTAKPSFGRSVLAVFGRAKAVPRAIRCSALVARGYVRVGAATDDASRVDLAWGYAPTGPC